MSIIIYFLFTLSGFIALIYESTWSRYLNLFLGHSSYGQILTLCIFMGGLGLGAFIAGRLAKRLTNPLYFYAIIELTLGMGGLVYHKAYLLTTSFFYGLASSYSLPPLILDLLKIALSTVITGPLAIPWSCNWYNGHLLSVNIQLRYHWFTHNRGLRKSYYRTLFLAYIEKDKRRSRQR
jgi:spermidine synthase